MSMRDYKVIKELGSGAFGTVMLVQQGSTKYCVKKVDVRRMPKKERDAAVKEAHVLRKFKHPNIVQYKDQFIEDGTLCIVVRAAAATPRAESSRAQGPPMPRCRHRSVLTAVSRVQMELAEDGDLHARLKKQRGRPLKEDMILNCERRRSASRRSLPLRERHRGRKAR
jgi:serine/threonine protein kinase